MIQKIKINITVKHNEEFDLVLKRHDKDLKESLSIANKSDKEIEFQLKRLQTHLFDIWSLVGNNAFALGKKEKKEIVILD